jgi:putative ABC transport system permease protein
VLLVAGHDPAIATLGGAAAGAAAGACTGLLHAILHIEPLLAGILVTTALSSVNLVVLGRSNVPLAGTATLLDRAEALLLPALTAAGCGDA